MNPDPRRAKDLARIHLAAKELGLDEAAYRDVLRQLTGKDSAGAMDARQRWKVLQELGRMGAKSGGPGFPGRPQTTRNQALIGKIEALLADAKRPWSYVDAMAQRMFQHNQVKDCDADQLRRIVAALEIDRRRRGLAPIFCAKASK